MREMIALRNDIKRLKKDDKVRYKEVYSTIINTLNEENALPRTNFNKEAVKFRLPKASDKLDQYKVEHHRFYVGTPEKLDKKKARKQQYETLADTGGENDISIDAPRINSPPEAKNSAYFEKVRRRNEGRLLNLKKVERKEKEFYDRVDEFIQNDQTRSKLLDTKPVAQNNE